MPLDQPFEVIRSAEPVRQGPMCCSPAQSHRTKPVVQGDSDVATTPAVPFELSRGYPGPRHCYPGCARCLLTYLADTQSGFFLWSLATSLSHQVRSAVVSLQSAPFERPAQCCAQNRRCPGGAPPSSVKVRQHHSMPTGCLAGQGRHQLPPLSVISSQPVGNKPSLHLYGTPSVAAIIDRRLPRLPVRCPGPYAAPSPTQVCATSGPSAPAPQASSQLVPPLH
ncbi:hypothetical protein NDU88_007433 [Pleurodeles waltl]|uniref:Uncharacterized protein n=1 Tax=Pleurodeles waltl TaxID=8319 RepID=A0AAV7QLT6_PLEWA|nr:hypothetical protein NDU88_007433 [Pleurodeles waltl]